MLNKRLVYLLLHFFILLSYSIIYRNYGDKAWVGIISIIPIVTAFYCIGIIENVIEIKKNLFKFLLCLFILILNLFFGYYISVVNKDALILIVVGYLITVFLLVSLLMAFQIKANIAEDDKKESTLDLVEDIESQFSLESQYSPNERRKCVKAITFSGIAIIFYMVAIIFTNVFSSNILLWEIILVSIIIVITIVFDLFKMKYYDASITSKIIEILLLTIGIIGYCLLQVLIVKNGINIFLLISSLLCLIPYLKSYFIVLNKYKEIYGR